ncbi:hypothetical protein A3D03_05570 [Candidatus Gottesmanbacteria bacterium RIFCSPHIGHO2_02_FULL_40_13]|uniref:site-specific DNA-methyltransferase (adenine-specific) n=1 Tax=Candidatus Gottesmanbacteria bacterium RIFCSPHIGHO2_02_FULL_40_13 TaxID=1798384 RepID=A0A1F6A818_9BACT|nr:MAG: hypothetical protein A3D03_05570 [Candidatus Gottesmanbacteria bacterium RIFCSPHIGHO2_02_FULL_40_13]
MSRDILDDIINDFSPEKFIRFFRSKNTLFSPRQEELTQYNDVNFKNGKKLGEINFKDNSLFIYSFQAEQVLSEKSGKKAQYEKGKKILKETQTDTGIFIYYDQSDNFRFSLVYANYLGKRRDWSTFRRFTYFVSREFTNKTFLQRIGDGDFSNLEKIKDAFSVEKVTKAFYTDIANWYFWVVQNVAFPQDAEEEKNGRNIAVIRLITRLIFIWFMKERGLISSVLFDQSEISKLLKDLSADKTTYYKAILQNLFFSTLNTKSENRKYRFQTSFQGRNKDYMDHSIYRYESYFKDNETMLTVFKDIPYLNGGLFDCLDKPSRDNENQGEIRIDGFTDKDVGLKVPNFLFFSDLAEVDLNREYGTKNKKYSVRGIINILSTYNFTIDENDPNDQEVALDPELLGKVFENLLASFNPETASTARKATGSYYTPREIVDYMVIQSLKNYLTTNLNDFDQLDNRFDQLLSTDENANPFNRQETLRIVKLIDDLRIVDPAVGSGAFPMGILNRLVFILSKLDPDNTLWKATQLKAVEDYITDPVLRKKLLDQIEEQFTYKNFDYGRKLYLIQKCIYGVDIQQIAVEIAKLRFFISLLVDEKIDKSKENWGIEPLPNLDYKIMQGNSLVEEYEGVKLFDERLLNTELPNEEEIVKAREKKEQIEKDLMPYYVKNPRWMKNFKLERPPELTILEGERNRILAIVRDLERLQQSRSEQANQIKMSLQDDDGKSQKVWEELQKLHKQIFTPSLARDERNKLRQKVDALEWKLIEETLREQNKIKALEKIKKLENSNSKPFFLWKLHFSEVFQEKGGFDIVIANPPYVSVKEIEPEDKIIFGNNSETGRGRFNLFTLFLEKGNKILRKEGVLTFILPEGLYTNVEYQYIRKYLLDNTSILFINLFSRRVFEAAVDTSIISVLKEKTLNNKFPVIKDLKTITTFLSQNYFYKLPAYLYPVNLDNKSSNIVYKVLNGKGNKTSSVLEIQQGIIYSGQSKGKVFSNVQIDKSQKKILDGRDVLKWFVNWKEKRENRYIFYSNNLHRAREERLFLAREKILLPRRSTLISCAYDNEQFYCLNTAYVCLLKSNKYNLKFILSILNSTLINYFYSKLFLGWQITIPALNSITIPDASSRVQDPFIKIVDQILVITGSSEYLFNTEKQARVKDYENQIDQLVYKLYGFTPEEIAIVEGQK